MAKKQKDPARGGAPAQEREDRRPLDERISDTFSALFSDLDRLQNATQVTEADIEWLKIAQAGIEDCEQRAQGNSLDAGPAKILENLGILLNAAITNVNERAELIEAGGDSPRDKRRAERAVAEQARLEARRSGGGAGEEGDVEELEDTGSLDERVEIALQETADVWDAKLNGLERRLYNFERRMAYAESRAEAVGDFAPIHESYDHGFKEMKEAFGQFDFLSPEGEPAVETPASWLEQWDHLVYVADIAARIGDNLNRFEDFKREALERAQGSEALAQEFTDSARAAAEEFKRVVALPSGTAAERFVLRLEIEGLVEAFAQYNKDWQQKAAEHLPNGVEWADVWRKAVDARAAAHEAYRGVKDRRTGLRGAEATDWEENRRAFDGKLGIVRARLIAAQTMRGDKRRDELAGIREYYFDIKDEWKELARQAPRDVATSPIGGVVRAIERDIDELIEERDVYVLRAQEAEGELGRNAVRAFGCWKDEKRFPQRSQFLHRYLAGEINDADPEFGEFVQNRDVFLQIVAPLARAHGQVLEQKAAQEAREAQRRSIEERKKLRHPWLSELRGRSAREFDAIVLAPIWQNDIDPRTRARTIRRAGELDDARLGETVANVGEFRRMFGEYQGVVAESRGIEEKMLAGEEITVEMSTRDLQRRVTEYRELAAEEWRRREALLALDGWKATEKEQRQKGIGMFWKSPNPGTVHRLADKPDQVGPALDAWREVVRQRLAARNALRFLFAQNLENAGRVRGLPKQLQVVLEEVRAELAAPAPEPAPVVDAAPAATPDRRREALADETTRREIGSILANDIFWEDRVNRGARFSRINALLRRGNPDARLNNDNGLRPDRIAAFHEASAFTDLDDLRARMGAIQLRFFTAPVGAGEPVVAAPVVPPPDAAPVAAAVFAPVAAMSTPPVVAAPPARPAIAPPPPRITVTARTPHVAESGPAAVAPTPSVESVPVATAVAATATSAEAPRTETPVAARTAEPVSVSAPVVTPEAPRATTRRVETVAPPAAAREIDPNEDPFAAYFEAETAAVVTDVPVAPARAPRARASAPAAESAPAVARTEAPRTERAPVVSESAPEVPVVTISPRAEAEAAAAFSGDTSVAEEPIRGAAPDVSIVDAPSVPDREPHREERVSGWASAVRRRVGVWFGTREAAPTPVAPRERAPLPRAEATTRASRGILRTVREFFGSSVLADVPRYLSDSFMAENQRAVLKADLLEVMQDEVDARSEAFDDAGRARANVQASERFERAIRTSSLPAEQKEPMIARLTELRTRYQDRTRENGIARSRELARALEESVEVRVAGWQSGRQRRPSALETLSSLPMGIGASVAYGVRNFRERFEQVARRDRDAGVIARVATVFRETWNEAQANLRRAGAFSNRTMNTAEAALTIGAAYAMGAAVTALEQALPSLRSLESEDADGVSTLVAEGRVRLQTMVDRVLPAAERSATRVVAT